MKKMLCALLVVSMMFVGIGCSNEDSVDSSTNETVDNSSEDTGEILTMSMGTSTIGGTSYVVGGGLANLFNNMDGFNVSVEVTGGPQTNLQKIEQGDSELWLITAALAGAVWDGEDFANGTLYQEARPVAPLWCSYLYMVTLEDSDINSLKDLMGKNVAAGSAGSSSDMCARGIIDLYNIDVRNYSSLTADAQKNGLKDKTIDVIFVVNGSPSPTIMDLETTHDLKFIQFTDEEIKDISENFPYWAISTISAGAQKHMSNDYETISLWQLLYADKDVPEDAVYKMTTKIFESYDELLAVDQGLKDAKAENIIYANTPLHAGAYKYYQENDIEIPDKSMPIN